MPKYTIYYEVIEEWKGVFEADNLEEAKKMVQDVINEDTNLDDLPEAESFNKGLFTNVDANSLEEWV